jgi:hypothetical protein
MASKGGSRRASKSDESTDSNSPPTVPAGDVAQFDPAHISTIAEVDSSASTATASVTDHVVSRIYSLFIRLGVKTSCRAMSFRTMKQIRRLVMTRKAKQIITLPAH